MNQHFCNPAASVDPSQQISIFLFPSPDQYCQLSVKIIRRNSCKTISAAQLRSWQYKYINVTIQKYIVIFIPCLEKKLCLFWHSRSHILFQNPSSVNLFTETCPYVASSCHQGIFWKGLHLVYFSKMHAKYEY